LIKAVVAVYSDWGIGCNGTQPLVIKADRRNFQILTIDSVILVGRKTLEDFPEGKPLVNRHNIVLTKKDLDIHNATVVHSVKDALAVCSRFPDCFVVGGASVYNEFFPYLEEIYVTKIDRAPRSDTFFPNLDQSEDWLCVQAGEWQCEGDIRYCFCKYKKASD